MRRTEMMHRLNEFFVSFKGRRIFIQFLKLIVTVYLAYYIGNYLGRFIIGNFYIFPIIFFLSIILLLISSVNKKFILLSAAVFFPFGLYGFGPIAQPMLIELMGPFMCIVLASDILLKKQPFLLRNSRIFFIAAGVLVLWSLVNFMRNPVSGFIFGSDVRASGIRAYYVIFTGITTFLSACWFFRYRTLKINKWFTLLLIIAFVLGYLRIYAFFNKITLPFLLGAFNFTIPKGTEFFRIGGISEMAVLGIIILLSLFHKEKWTKLSISALLGFIVLLFFSGGRTAFFATIMIALIYFVMLNRRYLIPALFLCFVVVATYIPISQGFVSSRQLDRLTSVEGGFEKQDPYRLKTFELYWNIFVGNPLFGKGIGYIEAKGSDVKDYNVFVFVNRELAKGGHGAYLSVMGNFGIGGIFFIGVMVFGSIFYAYKILKSKTDYDNDAKLILFAFLYLIYLSIIFITGFSGYDSMELWFLAGMVAGIKAKTEGEEGGV